MSDTTTTELTSLPPPHEIPPEPETVTEFVALSPYEMGEAHGQMATWAERKAADVETECNELDDALTVARKNGWQTKALERQLNLAARRLTFYTKVRDALRLGYLVIPNFAMDTFAVRTKAKSPHGRMTDRNWVRFEQGPQALAAGSGEYVNPMPTVYQRTGTVTNSKGEQVEKKWFFPKEFVDVEFPIALAHPRLMSATAQAMLPKLFDEIGVANDTRGSRRGDPVIIGRLRNPRTGRPDVSFFIGWYMGVSRI